MSIQTTAHGTVVAAPVEVQTDDGTAAVFVLAPSGMSSLATARSGSCPTVCEVWCRDRALASAVMRRLRTPEAVILVGQLWLEPVVGSLEDDLSAARVRIDADAIGVDLSSSR
jgi:hypothetical protein